jgi:hypothetical protein
MIKIYNISNVQNMQNEMENQVGVLHKHLLCPICQY